MGYTFHGDGPWGTGVHRLLHDFEVDNNFWQAIQEIAAKAVQGVGLANIVQNGNDLTFVLTDHTLIGPFELPGISLRFRGEWQPDTAYLVGDIFTHVGSTYMVLLNHTSAATFDPGANDGLGHNFYGLLLENPTLVIPAGGAAGTFLRKITSVDYIMSWQTAALTDLTDVHLTSPTPVTGDVLTYSGGLWVAGTTVQELTDLSDVAVSDSPDPTAGQVLTWNGIAWINENPIFNPSLATLASGQILVYDAGSGTWKNSNTADVPVHTVSTTFGAVTINYTQGAAQRITMTGGITLSSVSNWPAAGQLGRLLLEITNTGAFTFAWPAAYRWPGGAIPEVTVNGRDLFALTTFDGGVTVSGSVIGQNYL